MTPFKTPLSFRFAPRWKEDMAVTCVKGSFVLPFWMGNPTVELPSQDRWTAVAPDWPSDQWDELHRALTLWCNGNGAALEISDRSDAHGV
jgi:hypothetical protein